MTYEVYIDVEHHPRHNDDDAKHERTAFKLGDTGKPMEMVANCLRTFADELNPESEIVVYRNDGGLWLRFGDNAAVSLEMLLEGVPPLTASLVRTFCESLVEDPA